MESAAYYFVGPTYPFSIKLINMLLNTDADVKELIARVVEKSELPCTSTIDDLTVDEREWLGAVWFQTPKGIVMVVFPYCNDEFRHDGTATDRSVAFYTCIWEQESTKRFNYEREVDVVLSELLRIVDR